ncbi:arsenic transporter [Leptospirillum ferriphilum]|jgi:arsenical pump membrane protein|uniref:Arsenical pump membrane protein n=3 Tax=Leptospirillum ferriphilum TaxID=178606 RepID=A0A059XTD4_9BACT|nr:arsenic transporter [Leptospirillum ferriphilum]AFS53233.1 ArsB,arsenical pump membrane protein [Leptospirillum ferriphilum ML-04]AIA30295.1 arsenical pump membrane protein [Leptospirillum ferriphilum YSK]OOH75166.1 arsenical efflux pump membrane protein ArsB [Leptospirillum ferriphilum]
MLAAIVFILTLMLVILQPRGLGIGWSALIGAAADLALGVVHWKDVPVVWSIIWDATFTFVALIILSLLLDEAGFFHWAALHMGRLGQGRPSRLFFLVILLGMGVSAVFANDGAALILTPIVLAMLLSLGLTPSGALAFVIATGFVADTTSLPFIISNLVNIVSADFFHISFVRYSQVMVPVDILSGVSTLLVLWLYYRRHLPESYNLSLLESPRHAIRDPVVFRWGFALLFLLLIVYFVSAPLGIPVSLVTSSAAILLLLIAARAYTGGKGRLIPIIPVLKGAPWQIVLFSMGMYLVVYGLKNANLTAFLSTLLADLASHGLWVATIGTGFLSALLSSVMNNLPSVLIGALSIQGAGSFPDGIRESMIYANVIGCDLGPKFTPIGSLATLLWLHVLEKKGEHIGWGLYMRVGIVLTVPVLLATLAGLAGWIGFLGHIRH